MCVSPLQIDVEYSRKLSSISSKKKITAAKEGNKRRLELLQEQAHIVSSVVQQAGIVLEQSFEQDPTGYRTLMEALVRQGLRKLHDEPVVHIHCLSRDVAVAEAAVTKASEQFTRDHPESSQMKVSLDTGHMLQELFDKHTGEKCYGGVVISNEDRTIVCDNTLNARLNIAAEATLPQLKEKLFPTMSQLLANLTACIGAQTSA